MSTLSKAGEAMLLAQEGNRQIAQAIATAATAKLTAFKDWLRAMPASLPPTELPR